MVRITAYTVIDFQLLRGGSYDYNLMMSSWFLQAIFWLFFMDGVIPGYNVFIALISIEKQNFLMNF